MIHPDYQAQGIGQRMLGEFLEQHPTAYITTYTRNPAVMKMVQKHAKSVYPLDNSSELQTLATHMPYAEVDVDGTVYHFNRYDEGGLFRAADPADRPFGEPNLSLKQRFEKLQNIRHALVIAARVATEIEA